MEAAIKVHVPCMMFSIDIFVLQKCDNFYLSQQVTKIIFWPWQDVKYIKSIIMFMASSLPVIWPARSRFVSMETGEK